MSSSAWSVFRRGPPPPPGNRNRYSASAGGAGGAVSRPSTCERDRGRSPHGGPPQTGDRQRGPAAFEVRAYPVEVNSKPTEIAREGLEAGRKGRLRDDRGDPRPQCGVACDRASRGWPSPGQGERIRMIWAPCSLTTPNRPPRIPPRRLDRHPLLSRWRRRLYADARLLQRRAIDHRRGGL